MGKPSDRDKNYMYELWGTTNLTSDYGVFKKIISLGPYTIPKDCDFQSPRASALSSNHSESI